LITLPTTNIRNVSPETVMNPEHSQRKPLQEIHFQAALARKSDEPAQLRHTEPQVLKHTTRSQHWVIRRTYAGIQPSESKHVLCKSTYIYYGKTPFSCLSLLFSTFLLPSIVAWRQEGIAEPVVDFSAS